MKRLSPPGNRSAVWWAILLALAAGTAGPGAAATAPKKKPASSGAEAAKPAVSTPRKAVRSGAQDRAILGDKDVLARVGDRKITVYDFRDRYFSSYYAYRPSSDSAGRVQFLNSLIDKEILGLTARKVAKPLDFNDRTSLRELNNTALANAFFDRTIGDSVRVTESEIQHVYDQYKWTTHFRHILVADRRTAAAVRKELLAKKISWPAAVKKYSRAVDDVGPDGDMGWVKRSLLKGDFAIQIFDLKMGEISEPVQNADGVHLVQAVERTPVEPLAFAGLRNLIRTQIRGQRSEKRLRELHARIAREQGITYDTTNIRWVSDNYWRVKKVIPKTASEQDAADAIASMGGEQLKRVLVRSPDRQLTLGEFFDTYRALPPLSRSPIHSFESLHFLLENLFLQPELVKMAQARGLDQDADVVTLVERKREQIMVERMYQDSILSRMSIQPAQRRKYYEENKNQFVSNPKVEYAEFVLENEAAAKALVTKLAGGTSARSLAHADPALGIVDAALHEAYQERDKPYNRLLFDELKPGKWSQEGPDSKGHFKVTYEIAYSPQRQLRYEEVEGIVDESVQNIEADRRLREFIARHRVEYEIESHPERVMDFELVDPINDRREETAAKE